MVLEVNVEDENRKITLESTFPTCRMSIFYKNKVRRNAFGVAYICANVVSDCFFGRTSNNFWRGQLGSVIQHLIHDLSSLRGENDTNVSPKRNILRVSKTFCWSCKTTSLIHSGSGEKNSDT